MAGTGSAGAVVQQESRVQDSLGGQLKVTGGAGARAMYLQEAEAGEEAGLAVPSPRGRTKAKTLSLQKN